MIEISKVSYDVIVVTEKNLQLNITQAVEDLGWEENEDELAMKISFDMYNATYNGSQLSSLVKIGAIVAVKGHWGSGSGVVAMGNIIECTRKSSKSDEVFDVVAYDNLYNLQKSSDCVYFAKGKKTKSILTSIMKSGESAFPATTGRMFPIPKFWRRIKSWEILSGMCLTRQRRKAAPPQSCEVQRQRSRL